MTSLRKITAVLFVIGCIAARVPSLHAQDDDAAMIAGAKALDAAFLTAVNSGDADGLANTYWNSPDLVSFPPEKLVERGYESVTRGLREFVQSLPGVKLEMADPTYLVAGEYVVTYGTFKMTVPTPEGGMHEMMGRYTDVKAKRDGKWAYVHDHASMPLPPPPPRKE